MKYKRSDLEAMVAQLNVATGYKMDLDFAHTYGGYTLRYSDGHHIGPRVPIREMYQYLRGALDWVNMP